MPFIEFGVNNFLSLHIWVAVLFSFSSIIMAFFIRMKIHYRKGMSSSRQLLCIILVMVASIMALVGGYLLLYKTSVISFNQDNVVSELNDAGYKLLTSSETVGIQSGQKTNVTLERGGIIQKCELSVDKSTMYLIC